MTSSPPQRPGFAARYRWPLIVVLLLLAHAATIIWFITHAVSDENFAVVPNAYDQAVAFDTRKARLAETQNLGWELAVTVGSLVDAAGRRMLSVELTDDDGAGVVGASVKAIVSRDAGGAERHHVTLAPQREPGRYEALAPMGIAGLYTLEFGAGRGEGTEREQGLFDRSLRVGMGPEAAR